jgi:uncharacterized protein (DUF58 family)
MERSDQRLRFGLTDAGKVVLRGTGFVALAALIVPAFGVLAALVSVMFVALLIGLALRPRIQVSGNLPDRVIVGRTAQLTYVLKNTARLPAYNLRVRFGAPPEAIEQIGSEHVVARLGPGDTVAVTVTIRPKRRGYHRIQRPVCQSDFPFNLFYFGAARRDEETLLVLPAFSLLSLPLSRLSRHVNACGTRHAGRRGVFPEYLGNRPFVPGDSPRRIDARAWARLSVPATKEYDNDLDNYAALVLDYHIPEAPARPKSEQIKELEAAVSLCASVAFTINNDCLIDILLAGGELHQFTGWPRALRLEKIHEILAGVEPSRGDCAAQITPRWAERLHEIAQVFFILTHWDKAYQDLLERADRAGCHSTVLLVSGPNGTQVDEDGSCAAGVQLLSADDILRAQSAPW